MSHQTGIKANAELLKFFGKCKDGKTRVLKVSIENEELRLVSHSDVKRDWEKDYDTLVRPLIEESTPCYILYRLDYKIPTGYAWLLMSWVPESASVRQKMLYASTKATLKLEFGSGHIKEELNATSREETTLQGYHKHRIDFSTPAPLTSREEELAELRKTEVKTDFGIDTKQQTLGGINCPISPAAEQGLHDMRRGGYNYLQFRIDLEEEKIHLVNGANIQLSELPAQIPTDHARYHLYIFKHHHEGTYLESVVFVYSMPGYSCSIRERMMYSSCKGPFSATIEKHGIEVAKKLEIDDGAELTEEFLHEELHPRKLNLRPQFSKPKGPPSRGAKRLTKPQAVE
ncbi:twinfilin [Anopheles ziemanni]|uniref:twinfilin n=1 Tax=Anopheles coustani TaxID=139045 RepID=UPI002658BA78|nr:twinfilin [Anopheles coustani]XP_058171856.1 twinfilin [Anopheles ziemanni]